MALSVGPGPILEYSTYNYNSLPSTAAADQDKGSGSQGQKEAACTHL